ncbi:MAG: site-specific integrase [Candidatus Riflebacteria bacterium]|nr:site-specific integrase [Candidatus Riflebacteria bacterium]
MRLNEICQLRTEDIVTVDGILAFDLNDTGEKVLKNLTSSRIIPIHPDLIRIGFLDYVAVIREKGLPRLWMKLTRREDSYAKQFSSYFQRFNRKYITDNPRKVMHSFRHMFANQLKQACVRTEIISELLGHTHGSISIDRYGKPFDAKTLLGSMNALRFEIPTGQLVEAAKHILSQIGNTI